jgi:ribosomal-protein-alanine N-acetyltransferase
MLEEFQAPDRIAKAIASERLKLRQYRLQDVDEFHTLYSDSFQGHLEPWSPVSPRDESTPEARKAARHHVLAALEKWDDGSDYRFFITLRETGEIVGQLGITQVVRNVSMSASIGYWIGRNHLNKGFATEALVLGIEFAFDILKLHRISLWISPKNGASLKVAEKLGLRYEGTAERALFLGGYWQDTKIFAMTSEEWSVRKSELRASFAP